MMPLSIRELVPLLAGLCIGAAVLAVGRLVAARWRLRPAPLPHAPLALPDPFRDGAASEKRSWARRQGSPVPILFAEERQAAPRSGQVIDRSPTGLGMLVPLPVPIGSVLRVRPADACVMVPWSHVLVKSCCQSGGEWRLGCQFQPAPPWSVLLLFG
jgi:hypothetical protein